MPVDAQSPNDQPSIAIIVLNWNNPEDTVRCIASILSLRDPSLYLLVVDNASSDDSVARIVASLRSTWDRGRVSIDDRSAARIEGVMAVPPPRAGDAVVIRTTHNLGYAGGNNVAIRAALAAGCQAVWILNNDTVVDSDALGHLRAALTESPDAGAIGTLILDADRDRIQCVGGGRYSWWRGTSQLLGEGVTLAELGSMAENPRIDYVSGASMLIPASTVNRVGLLDERFFLYCEEVDYAERCRRVGHRLVVSTGAVVRHRFGATIGSSRSLQDRSQLSAYHASRSAMLLVRRHRPWLLPSAWGARVAWGAWLAIRGPRDLAWPTVNGATRALLTRGAPQ